jgi:hypothetical protein
MAGPPLPRRHARVIGDRSSEPRARRSRCWAARPDRRLTGALGWSGTSSRRGRRPNQVEPREEATELLQGSPHRHRQSARQTYRCREALQTTAANGIESETSGPDAGTRNLVARLPGGDGPSLLLMAHTDTVLADAEEWARDPGRATSSTVRSGARRARHEGPRRCGTVAFASLAREGVRPAGDVVLALTPTRRSARLRDVLACREAPGDACGRTSRLNEGGGERYVLGGRVFYLCAVAEKAPRPSSCGCTARAATRPTRTAAGQRTAQAAPVLEALGRVDSRRRLDPGGARLPRADAR